MYNLVDTEEVLDVGWQGKVETARRNVDEVELLVPSSSVRLDVPMGEVG
jgi:hypothetical protein